MLQPRWKGTRVGEKACGPFTGASCATHLPVPMVPASGQLPRGVPRASWPRAEQGHPSKFPTGCPHRPEAPSRQRCSRKTTQGRCALFVPPADPPERLAFGSLAVGGSQIGGMMRATPRDSSSEPGPSAGPGTEACLRLAVPPVAVLGAQSTSRAVFPQPLKDPTAQGRPLNPELPPLPAPPSAPTPGPRRTS